MTSHGQSIYTRAIHAGEEPDSATGALATPIYQTATFAYPSADHAARLYAYEAEGYRYSRWGNPTVAALEAKMADLEGGEAALAAASGMAAVTNALLSAAKSGDHIVAAETLYGGTHHFLTHEAPRLGLDVSLVDATGIENLEAAIRENTVALYIESPANPTMKLVDIEAAARLAQRRGLVSLIDNTFATPYCQRPIELGIDLVIHSATKYLSGHGDVIAGVTVGGLDRIESARVSISRHLGGVLGPFDAWLVLRGIHTLPLRVARHSENALRVARSLEDHPRVQRVYYPGLESHPQHELAVRQMPGGFGGMVAFEVTGGIEGGRTLLDHVRLCTQTVSLGDARTLITHPASTTHNPRVVSREERLRAGLSDGLIRLSVGLEDPDEILADLDQALNAS